MRRNDNSTDHTRWTNHKLMVELQRYADMTNMSVNLPENYVPQPWHRGGNDAEAIREATRIYRVSWLDPLIAEATRRLCKLA